MARWILAFALLPAVAGADESEWRAGIGGGGTVVNARAGGAEGSGPGFGARVRLAYAISDMIELGLLAGYTRVADIAFDSATLDGQTGRLFANLSTFTLAAELRWTPGIALARAFERTGPYVAVRAGATLALRTSQQVFTSTSLLLVDAGDDLHIVPVAGGALGVEHRFGDRFFLAAELSAGLGATVRSFSLTAEAAWAWY